MCGDPISQHQLLELAVEIEGHPDNVAPAMLGGCQIGVQDDGRLITSQVPLPRELKAVLFVPDVPMSTDQARNILPSTVDRADAVYNIGRVALLVRALTTGDLQHLNVATQDRLHQPARQELFFPMKNILRGAMDAGALGVFLSGAGSSVLALTRQGLPTVRTKHTNLNLTSRGAYVLAEADHKRRAILLATGSEVAIAIEAKALLEAKGLGARVVSMPCFELFGAQDEAYRRKVLPAGAVRVAVEAAVRQGWDRWLMGERGAEKKAGFIGMDSFGASAPAGELYKHFGITAEAVAEKALALM